MFQQRPHLYAILVWYVYSSYFPLFMPSNYTHKHAQLLVCSFNITNSKVLCCISLLFDCCPLHCGWIYSGSLATKEALSAK